MDTTQKLDHFKTIYGHKDLSLGCVKDLDTKPKHDRFCDVTLVVSDAGKEFQLKAHRDVLAEASPFFEKLLHSDMKENKEGVIRLDILSESVLKNVLDFIYTGSVEILAPQHAEELIVAADYLFLSNLKNFAGRFLGKTLCVLNCLSYLDFAEKYQCEMLVDYTKDFIHANFPAVAECEEFFNLSSEEVERWISSDEINVSAEEEVFEIICRWIKQRKDERKPKFSELFRHVRLIYISRDYLSKTIKKNSLVKNTRQCLASVTSAISWLDRARESLDLPSPQPIRKSLEKHVIVIAARKIVCFLPDNGTWYKLPKSPSKPAKFDRLALRGNKMEKLSSLCQVSERYDALLNRWTSSILPRISDFTEAWLDTVHDTGEDIYATLCNGCGLVVSLWKYNQSSGSWRSIALPYARNFPCVAFKEKFVYTFGGVTEPDNEATTHSARLDTVENNWKEITAMQTARYGAYGVAAHGKIFVLGGFTTNLEIREPSCEVYNIETNEWHFIASLPYLRQLAQVLFHGTKLYLVGGDYYPNDLEHIHAQLSMDCYDTETNEWTTKIAIPQAVVFRWDCFRRIAACSVKIPKRTLDSFRTLKSEK